MRILFAIPTLEAGGTERQLLYLLRGLHREHELAVVCTTRAGAWAQEAQQFAEVHVLHARGGWDFRQYAQALPVLRRFRPDVVHTFLFGFDYWINCAARAVGVPAIISGRRQLARWKKARHVQLQRMSNGYVDGFLANSAAVADFAAQQEGRDPADYTVIPNAVDTEFFACDEDEQSLRQRYNISDDRRVVGMVANFSPVKNHAFFLEVAGELLRAGINAHFLLVGSGPLQEPIRRAIAKCGWSDRFTIVANAAASDVPALYRVMDVHVLTSHDEGAPNVLLEAMAAGAPVVAAAVGGVPEIVEDGVTGRLVTPGDVGAFARAVRDSLEDAAETAAQSAAALCRVRGRHSLASLAEAHIALYARLLNDSRMQRAAG
ncbi:MAG: glycosyltransferase [Candidatus Hydrogenedentales bacterium]